MLAGLQQRYPGISQFENDFEEVLLEYDRQNAAGRAGLRQNWRDAIMKEKKGWWRKACFWRRRRAD